VDKFDEALDVLERAASSKTGIEEAIATLENAANEANNAFALREDVLTNFNKSK